MSVSEIMPPPVGTLLCDPGADQAHVEVVVLDGRLEPIAEASLGGVELEVPAGAYKVEFRTAADRHSELVVVTEPGLHLVTLPRALRISSAVPVADSSTSHEWQSHPAEEMSRSEALLLPDPPLTDGRLFLFVREHVHEYDDPAPRFNPGRGLTLHRLDGTLLADLGRASPKQRADPFASPPRHGRYDREGRWAAHHLALEAGAYLLRLDTGSGWVQNQIVQVLWGWQTQVFLIARTYGAGRSRRRRADLARMSVQLARPGAGFQAYDRASYLTEVALQALAGGRATPGSERPDILHSAADTPMLELLGAFLRLRRRDVDPYALRFTFENLYALLGPVPDVLALGWAIAGRGETDGRPEDAWGHVLEQVRAAGPIAAPPMLGVAWDALLEASFSFPNLIPSGSIFDEVSTRARLSGAWLVWTTMAPTPDSWQAGAAPRGAPGSQSGVRRGADRGPVAGDGGRGIGGARRV